MSNPTLALLNHAVPGLARYAITQAADDARHALPAAHPARLHAYTHQASPDAADEALARAWFHHLAELPVTLNKAKK